MRVGSRIRVVSRVLFSLVLLGGFACSARSQAKTLLVEPPVPLLPAQSGKWVKETVGFDDSAQADSAVLAEDGVKRSERGVYRLTGNPTTTITVTAYEFVDATGAHAAYSYYLRPGAQYKGPKIGDETGDGYLFRSGTSVVSAESKAPGVSTNAMLSELETHLPKVGGPKGLAPLLPTYLPVKGLKTETVKYALGPAGYKAMGGSLPAEIVGFDKAAEAVMAKYEGQGVLTLLLYPTPQIAGEHGRAIEAEIHREGAPAGTVVMRREGPLLLLTTGAWGAAEAKKMVESIHLRNEVTWNKAVPLQFHAEVLKTYSLLTSIVVFCGVGALAAVILGLFLGGGRAAIRVLQGKPAASEPEFLRIDLSGSSAKLKVDGRGAQPGG